LHPLRKFPGPIACAASCIPKIKATLAGKEVKWIIRLHEQYGEVVRVKPGELSFSSADSWKAIYSHRRAGDPEFIKAPKFYARPGSDDDGAIDIISASKFDHSRIRRVFSGAFSDRALKMQESMFLTHVDKLIAKMKQRYDADPKSKFNMVRMYNFTTFDVMGDLTFGEPLGMLDSADYHPWVADIFSNFRFGAYLHSIRNYPALESILLKMIPKSIEQKRRIHNEFSSARVDRRLEKKEARPDIWGLVLARDKESGLTKNEMYANASLFMLAGTETTATLLSGVTYYLLKNPDKLRILTEEIRAAFEKEEDITFEQLQALNYLRACLEEGLRMYPPVSNGLPRIVPEGGAEVAGQNVPAGVSIRKTSRRSSKLTPSR
jgi:cytochrome P450